ncbi:MAG: 50S ribosomal protein L25, partial [Alistipes sp.]|nr:50S ribosomal protein L25 [Alistipes sp.]
MKTIQIAAVKRDVYGKKASKAVRREGMVPCAIYGGEETV